MLKAVEVEGGFWLIETHGYPMGPIGDVTFDKMETASAVAISLFAWRSAGYDAAKAEIAKPLADLLRALPLPDIRRIS